MKKYLFLLAIVVTISFCLFSCDNTSESLSASISNVRYSSVDEKLIFDAYITDKEGICDSNRIVACEDDYLTTSNILYESNVECNKKYNDITIDKVSSGTLVNIYIFATISGSEQVLTTYSKVASGGSISDITLSDKTVDYDGKSHSIYVSNCPVNTSVTYTNNSQTEPGVYQVSAKIIKSSYNNETKTYEDVVIKELTALLKINKKKIDVDTSDLVVMYNGYSVKFNQNYPVELNYEYYDENDAKIDYVPKDAGIYYVKISYPGDNHFESINVKKKIVIERAIYTCDCENQVYEYDGNVKEYIISSDDFNVENSDFEVIYSKDNPTEVGTYKITIHIPESTNYYEYKKITTLQITNQIVEEDKLGLLFSEYMNNDSFWYVELFNASKNRISLEGYSLSLYSNGEEEEELGSFPATSIDPYATILIGSYNPSFKYFLQTIDIQKRLDMVVTTQDNKYQAIDKNCSLVLLNEDSVIIDTIGNYNIDESSNSEYSIYEKLMTRKSDILFSNNEFDYNEWDFSEYIVNGYYNFSDIHHHSFDLNNDTIPPTIVINYAKSHTINYGDFEEICDLVDAYDSGVKIPVDISMITIPNDIKLSNTYEIEFNVSDSNGNCINFTIPILIVDTQAPTIELNDVNTCFEVGDSLPDFSSFFYVDDNFDGFDCVINLDYSNVDMNKAGNYKVTISAKDSSGNESKYILEIHVGDTSSKLETTDMLANNGPDERVLESVGSPNVLVVPVSIDSYEATDSMLEEIKIAFNGTNEETGWRSVNSYYKESSFDKLNINFVVTDWVKASKSKKYYESLSNSSSASPSDEILHDVLCKLDTKYNFNEFDNDSDGYIDAIWLVNNLPYDSGSTDYIWWAYTTSTTQKNKYDGLYGNLYCFASFDFLKYDSSKTSSSDSPYAISNNYIDAHTYIHETGHLLGLDDYYNYARMSTRRDGLYGSDIMDKTVGDHNSLSKLLLGWVKPKVINDSAYVQLQSYETSGDCAIIVNGNMDTIYKEYFIIELYSTKGLNEFDHPMGNNAYGIRLLHCDATINYNIENIPVENGGTYQTKFKYDNTDGTYRFITQLVSNNQTNGLFNKESMSLNSLYSRYKLHNGDNLFFDMKVNSISSSDASISIKFY